jgi:hypothetical protein
VVLSSDDYALIHLTDIYFTLIFLTKSQTSKVGIRRIVPIFIAVPQNTSPIRSLYVGASANLVQIVKRNCISPHLSMID